MGNPSREMLAPEEVMAVYSESGTGFAHFGNSARLEQDGERGTQYLELALAVRSYSVPPTSATTGPPPPPRSVP